MPSFEQSKLQGKIGNLTENYYIVTSMQKISSIHQFILETQQILEPHNLIGHTHFWLLTPKNYWSNFHLS